MDILLINLPCKKITQETLEKNNEYYPSLGLLSIATYCGMHGFDAQVIDYNYCDYSIAELKSIIDNTKPKLIGFTVYTENSAVVGRLSKVIKEMAPNCSIFVGGPHASLSPQYFKRFKSIDYVILGEGESACLELLVALTQSGKIDVDQIENVLYNLKDNNYYEIKRIQDLDLLPMIDRRYADLNRFTNMVSLYSSKGCPGNCIYCSATALSGASYRTRSASNIYLEMLTLDNMLPNKINFLFVDDTMTAIKKRVRDFVKIVKKYTFSPVWSCESRMDVIDFELIDALYESGCRYVQFGIESGSQDVIDKLKKRINLSYAKKIIAYSVKYPDFVIYLSFMFGHYCDTPKTMQETLDFISEALVTNKNIIIAASYNTPFPGTYQYDHAQELGLHFITRNFTDYDMLTPIVYTDTFTVEQLKMYKEKADSLVKKVRADFQLSKSSN